MSEVSRRGIWTDVAVREGAGNDVVLLLGRVLMAAIFLNSGFHKLMGLEGFAGYLAGHGLPAGAYPIAVLAACVEFFGALCVLIGFGTRYAALLLAAFTLVAALIAHRFWEVDPAQYTNQMNHFMKNITIVGGFLVLYVMGAGRFSVDRSARSA
jgi:putative oxidoreductase